MVAMTIVFNISMSTLRSNYSVTAGPMNLTRDVHVDVNEHATICYGDSAMIKICTVFVFSKTAVAMKLISGSNTFYRQ